jgi:phosphate transport system regulatory protein PhoU
METRTTFHKEIREIQDEILVMGSMVNKAILQAIAALQNRDLTQAKQVIADDQKINHKRFEIEDKCIQLIATQQPMASDLRIIVSALNIITELERIGDYAEGNAKIAIMIGEEPPLKPLVDIPVMAEKTVDMLDSSLIAFINHDINAARIIGAEDNLIDNLYAHVFQELLALMTNDPKTITRATRLMRVAHNLERSADRITNICERITFMVTGEMEEINGPKVLAGSIS